MSEEQLPQPSDCEEPPDPAVTLALFREWRAPRFGRSNPERMNNPVWEWLIRSKLSAYQAAKQIDEKSSFPREPGWCFDRMGQTSTQLGNGRCVLIAGEHEDWYDPDFYIYNDVVVLHPDGKMDVFGYPRDVFPPTDFHTATHVGNRIVIIGSLGYFGERKYKITSVFILDLETFVISSVTTCDPSPGWIHKHSAVLSLDGSSILIKSGNINPGGEDSSLVENINEWRLSLDDWRWEQLTDYPWQRREFLRVDRKQNHLWEMDQAIWYREAHWEDDFRKQLADLVRECGATPDLALMSRLYEPPISHEALEAVEDESDVSRIKVNGVVVRYVRETHSVQMTVEGDLPPRTIEVLTSDLLEKLTILENSPCEVRQL